LTDKEIWLSTYFTIIDKEVIETKWDITNKLKKCRVPNLIVYGRQDDQGESTFICKKNMFKILFIVLLLHPIIGFSQVLTNNTNISITKTWPLQPNGYTYPISISVPSGPVPPAGFPVCILLHGNGSQNPGNLAGPPMLGPNQFGGVLPCHILVAPTGFENSWNICAENSDAPDVDMIKDLVINLQSYANVNPNKIRVLGSSNGAGLANRVFIENTNPGIDIICAIVSHLNDFQYHAGNFYKPSGITNSNSSFCGYDVVSNPLTTRKYLSISNVNDPIIPYLGGPSNVGANFLPAETAAFYIATYKGYTGSILTAGTAIGTGSTAITEFSYLSGNVVHIKGNAAHQVNATQKTYITGYFSDCAPVVGIEDINVFKIDVYPNPANDILNIKVNAALLGADYTVHDHLGRTQFFGKINSENTRIDMTNLSKGFYYLIIGGNLNQVMKVVKI
jgi:poly(3-hydroxybutyrate) depolymerase